MKDHQIAELVNRITKKIQPLCPEHQSLRERVASVVREYFKSALTEEENPRTLKAAGVPSHNWEATAERSFECSMDLESENNRMRWLIRQILTSLPQKRDWLNPDYEREMRVWAKL